MDEKNIEPLTNNLLGKNYPVFDLSGFKPAERTDTQKLLLRKMEEVEKKYKEFRLERTLDLQITEEAFKKLKGRHGMSGKGFSRLVSIIERGKPTYHLVVSSYTNVQEISKSKNPEREELTLTAGGLSLLDDPEIGFELAVVSSKGVSEIEDRSHVYLKDIIKIELIPLETAKILTSTI